jgi:hypothetical protein
VKPVDRYLQNVRIGKAKRFVRPGSIVVDIGCADATMFERWRGFINHGYGVEPGLENRISTDSYTLLPGRFPAALPAGTKCDVITMLAVLEHIARDQQAQLPRQAHDVLNEAGRLIITVPSPRVDDILRVLIGLHVLDGMAVEEHYGFDPAECARLFGEPLFRLIHSERFQLGLNNLYVFEKI